MVRSPDVGEGWGGIHTFPTAITISQLRINSIKFHSFNLENTSLLSNKYYPSYSTSTTQHLKSWTSLSPPDPIHHVTDNKATCRLPLTTPHPSLNQQTTISSPFSSQFHYNHMHQTQMTNTQPWKWSHSHGDSRKPWRPWILPSVLLQGVPHPLHLGEDGRGGCAKIEKTAGVSR